MAPKTKATQSHLSNLRTNLSLKGGPFPRPDESDGQNTGNSFPNISKKVAVKDWPESDSESGKDDLFDFDGIGHGPKEDDSHTVP